MAQTLAPVRRRDGTVLGVVTVAGPLFRLTEERMLAVGPALVTTTDEIASASGLSPLFRHKAA